MAWNVVIAGGGFGGLAAARELEKVMPKQSARLMLINEQNYATYAPFLPEAAAGTLEPRHVVTPLRDILKRTYLRLGEIVGHDPEAKTVELAAKGGGNETIPYDQLLLSLGSVSRVLPIPGLTEHAMGFKGLADAIVLRNRVVENLELANATGDHQRREELLTFVFVGGGYAGLEALAELQDFAADAMDSYPRARLHGMRWILVEAAPRVLPEIDQDLADYAVRELRGRGIEIKLETTLKELTGNSATLSTGEVVPTTTVVWTAGVAPAPILKQLNVPLDERGRVPVDDHLPADRPARRPPGPRRGPQHRRGARRRQRGTLHLSQRGLFREPRPLQGGRADRRSQIPRLPRLVPRPQLPHEPDSGLRPQGPRGPRLDRQHAVQARHRRARLGHPAQTPGLSALSDRDGL
jgi:NADH dehydrogenase